MPLSGGKKQIVVMESLYVHSSPGFQGSREWAPSTPYQGPTRTGEPYVPLMSWLRIEF